jgi:hypothetical protein
MLIFMFLLRTEKTRQSEHYRKDRTEGTQAVGTRVLGQVGRHKVARRGQLERTDEIVQPGQE